MRVVLDTNVVVSALIWGGTPYRLIKAAADGDIELCTSPALLIELREVMGREHLASRLAQQRSSVEQAIGFYGELAISVSPLTTPRVVPGDADDDHVIAAALAAKADLVVSGDRHLLSMGSYEGMSIVDAAEAVARISRS
ncbi:MAG: putative toxin-antitoxin system toxin component, PIN family [Betaproteobacteria bacterium]|nr:putative toxin-antitoxin system toxin component, PIN family [Betaproteobacteria bacterium]